MNRRFTHAAAPKLTGKGALRIVALAAGVTASTGPVPAARAQSYTFANVLRSGGQLSGFDAPSVNPTGTAVTFRGTQTAGGTGVFSSPISGAVVGTVAVTGGAGGYTGFGSRPAINAAGTVAFGANTTAGAGVFTSTGGAATTVAVTSTTGATPFSGFTDNNPSINAAGTVAFSAGVRPTAARPRGGNGVYVAPAGGGVAVQEVAFTAAASNGDRTSYAPPNINTSGRVAYTEARTAEFSRSVVTNGVGGPRTVVGGTLITFQPTALNDAGRVVYGAGQNNGTFTSDGTTSTTIDSLRGATAAAINGSGLVAYSVGEGGSGTIRSKADATSPILTVIQPGDALDGSTVAELRLSDLSLTETGRIVFAATLADGRQGIYVATFVPVPEPATVGLAAAGALGLVRLARNRRRTGR